MLGPPWPRKPPVGATIDWGAPIARGLVACVPLWEGTGLPVEVVSGTRATAITAGWSPGPRGPQLSATGNGGFVAIQTPTLATAWTGPISVACYAAPTTGSVGQFLTAGNTYFLRWGGYGTSIFSAGIGSSELPSSSAVVDGLPHIWGATLYPASSGTSALYRDGAAAGTGAITTSPSVTHWLSSLGCSSSQTGGIVGPLGWAMIWGRPLSAADHAAIAAYPWRVFSRPGLPTLAGIVASQAAPATAPTGTPAITGIGYQFAGPVDATNLAIVVTVAATRANVPGTVSYDSSTHLASFIPAAANPLVAGVKYEVTVSGAAASDGTPMVPVTYPFLAGGVSGVRWTPALGRPRGRLRA